jgi:hypothetical protein
MVATFVSSFPDTFRKSPTFLDRSPGFSTATCFDPSFDLIPARFFVV